MPHGNRVSPGNSRIPSEAKLHPIRMMPSTPELKEQQQQQQHLSAFSNVSTHSFQPSNSPASSDQHGQQGGDDALLLQELQSPAPTAREPLPLLDIVSPELGKPPQHPLSTAPSSPFIISRGGSRQGSRRVTPVPRASSTPTELGPQILGEGRVQGGDIPGHLQGASPGGDRGDEARLSLHRELTPNSLQDASLSHRGGSSELPQQGTGEEQQHHMRTSRQGNTGERKPSSQEHDSAQEVGAASGWVSPQGVVGEQILGSSSEGEHTPVLGVSQGREEGWIGEPSFAVQGGRALGEGRDSEEAHVMFADTKKQGSGDDYEEPWEQQRVGFVETGDEQDTPPAKRGLFKTARGGWCKEPAFVCCDGYVQWRANSYHLSFMACNRYQGHPDNNARKAQSDLQAVCTRLDPVCLSVSTHSCKPTLESGCRCPEHHRYQSAVQKGQHRHS